MKRLSLVESTLLSKMRKLDKVILELNSYINSRPLVPSRKTASSIDSIGHGEQPVEKKATVFYPPH